jgi:hypothetical protein
VTRIKVLIGSLVVVAAVVMALTAASGAKAAAPFPCPPEDGWFLTPPSPGDVFYDKNGDGLICVKGVPGRGSSVDVPGFTARDDLFFFIP